MIMEVAEIATIFVIFVLGVLKFALVFGMLFVPILVLVRVFTPSQWLK